LKPLRPIRSYVLREGRLTSAQKRALNTLAEKYFVTAGDRIINASKLFGRDAPTVLEIGFGDGKSLSAMAQANPGTNYLGVEVHRPGIGNLLQTLDLLEIKNVRVYPGDAIELIKTRVADSSIDAVHLFFPDPWPKKRHHKRRIVQQSVLSEFARVLKPGGRLHMATDWQDYAEHMMRELSEHRLFSNTSGFNRYSDRPSYRPETKFERRGLSLGHKVRDLIFKRV